MAASSVQRLLGRGVLGVAAAVAVSGAGAARASTSYPPIVRQVWVLPAAPACTLCHLTSKGGTGTVKTKFGVNIHVTFGAKGGGDTASLLAALRSEDKHTTDSDGDGVGDHQELYEGSDPNVKDRQPPTMMPPMGDGGGAAGDGQGGNGQGGDGSVGAPAPSVWTPPSAEISLPPPLENGCALAAADRPVEAGAAAPASP